MSSKNFFGLFKKNLVQSFACVYGNNNSTQSAAILTLNMLTRSWSSDFSGPTGDAWTPEKINNERGWLRRSDSVSIYELVSNFMEPSQTFPYRETVHSTPTLITK